MNRKSGKPMHPPHATSAGLLSELTLSRIRICFSFLTQMWARMSFPHGSALWSPFLQYVASRRGFTGRPIGAILDHPVAPSKNEFHPCAPC